MDDNRNDKSDYQETVTIKKLEEHTWENTATWFNDKDGKNAGKRVFLKDIFRVAKMEERYRKGELGTLVKRFAIAIAYMQQMKPLQSPSRLVTESITRCLMTRKRMMTLKCLLSACTLQTRASPRRRAWCLHIPPIWAHTSRSGRTTHTMLSAATHTCAN
jgi:hypothetical protein